MRTIKNQNLQIKFAFMDYLILLVMELRLCFKMRLHRDLEELNQYDISNIEILGYLKTIKYKMKNNQNI